MPDESIRKDLDDTMTRVGALEDWRPGVDRAISQLGTDINAMRADLAKTATKSDLALIGERMATKSDINGLLRDALNAMPAKHANIFAGLMVLVMIAAIVIPLVHR